MKIVPERSCKRRIRNLHDHKDFFVRIEYQNKQIAVSTWNHDTQQLENCVTLEQEIEYEGIFLVTAGSGIKNPDHVYLEYFGLYNMHEKISDSLK